jgi:hypothetical protein
VTAALVAAAPTSLDELLARSGPAAVELSGAGQTAWNGSVVETTGAVLGLADWDGTLYLSRDHILDPLRHMYEHAGEWHPVPTLERYREALATLLHEQAHFLGPAGATQEAARGAFTRPGARQLEEGVAEAWAQNHLNEYLTNLGVDKVAPGIKDVRANGYYPAFVPAVRILTADLETRNDLNPGELLNALNNQTAAGQFPLLLSVVYNSTRLPELGSPDQGAENRRRLETLLREGLNQLDAFELFPSGFAAARSQSFTGALLNRMHTEIRAAESEHFPHPNACELPAPTPVATGRLIPHPLHTALSGLTRPAAAPSPRDAPSPATPHIRRHLPSPLTHNPWSRPGPTSPQPRS